MIKLGQVTFDKWEDFHDPDGNYAPAIFAKVIVNGQQTKVVVIQYPCGHVQLIAVGKGQGHHLRNERAVTLLEDHVAAALCTPSARYWLLHFGKEQVGFEGITSISVLRPESSR